jgi:hypothetical protein
MGCYGSHAILAYTDSYNIGLLLNCASHKIALMRGTSELGGKAALALLLVGRGHSLHYCVLSPES